MRKLILFLAIIIPSMLHAQTSKNGRIQEGLAATRPIACSPGDVWTDTDDALSFQCFPANSWNTFAGSNILPNNNTFTGNNKFSKPLVIGPFTVATLPSPGATALNAIATVTDGTSGADCVTGGSTFQALCINTGAAWLSLGGGSGGTPCTTTALSIQFNNSGAFGCEPDLTFTSPHTLTLSAAGILSFAAGATVNGITNAMLPNPLTANTSGNAATATALASAPTTCGAGNASTGVNASGNAVGCFTPGGLTNPMTTIGDIIIGGSAGAATRLAGPTTPNGVAQTLIDVPAAGAATPEVWALPGVPVRANTATTDTIAVTDRAGLVTESNASPVAVTGPSPTSNFPFALLNLNTGLVTETPASGTINGNATQIIPQNWFALHYTDNSNWFAPVMPTLAAFPNCATALTINTATGAFGCNAGIGTGTVTHTVAALALGLPMVGNGASDSQTVPEEIDASVQTGADDCAKTSGNWANLNALGGVNDARAFNGTTNACAASFMASYPSNFAGKLEFGSDVQLQMASQILFSTNGGAIIEGNSGHPVTGPAFTAVGTGIQAANAFPTSTALVQIGTSSNVPGVSFKNIRLSCMPPSGTQITGCITYKNLQGQEGTSLWNVFLDGSPSADFYVAGSGAQQGGPYIGITSGENDVNSTAALGFQLGDSATTSLIANSTLIQGSFGGTANAAAQVNCGTIDFTTNWVLLSGHCEQVTNGIEIGSAHVAHNIAITNWGFTATAGKPMTSAIDISATAGGDNLLFSEIDTGNANVTNIVKDNSATNPCTIVSATESNNLGWYWRSNKGGIFTSSPQCADVFPAHNENFSSATINLPAGAGFASTATSNVGRNTTNGAFKIWTGVDSDTAFFPASTPPAGGSFVKTTGVIGQLVEDSSLSQPGAIHSTGNTAAISTATLCAASAGACNQAGQYHVHFDFIETGTACATPATGGVTFLLTWTDTNGTTHSAVSLGMDDASAINAVSQTFHFQTSLAAAWGSGDFNVSTNGSIIQYATGYTACGVGVGQYQLDVGVTRIQ